MNFDKLDKRLIEEIRVRRESDLIEGKTPQETERDKFVVTIELVDTLEIPSGMTRERAIREMEKRAKQAQAGVIDTLRSIGVTDFERLILSNSIATTLTIDQINEIARRSDVKNIRLVKEEEVTL